MAVAIAESEAPTEASNAQSPRVRPHAPPTKEVILMAGDHIVEGKPDYNSAPIHLSPQVAEVFAYAEPIVRLLARKAYRLHNRTSRRHGEGRAHEQFFKEAGYSGVQEALFAAAAGAVPDTKERVFELFFKNIQAEINGAAEDYNAALEEIINRDRAKGVPPRRGQAAPIRSVAALRTSSSCEGSRAAGQGSRTRSAVGAGGGSSGDDPGGDSDPPGLRPESGREHTKGRKFCLGCGHELIGRRPQTLYHDDACRKRFDRSGKVAKKPATPGHNWQAGVQKARYALDLQEPGNRLRFIRELIEVVECERRRLQGLNFRTTDALARREQHLEFYDRLLNGQNGRVLKLGLWDLLRQERRLVDHGYPFYGTRPTPRVKFVPGWLA